ncbi:MAG: hypothetical protein ACFE9I_02000 [Candidatus Hermodarchaeota archaeon]
MAVYICRTCNYAFPDELSHLIENNIQVYCERCGSPFNLEGVKFRPAPTPYIRDKKPYRTLSESKSSNLEKVIRSLDKISLIPIIIFTIISFIWIFEIFFDPSNWFDILFRYGLQGFIGFFIIIYDSSYISSKIKEKNYNVIFLDAFCWGILGCVLYGTGVILLIKGIFIILYVITDKKNNSLKIYDFGLLIKNSLNYFSAKAGFLIILFGIYGIYLGDNYLLGYDTLTTLRIFDFSFDISDYFLTLAILFIISFIALIIDFKSRGKLKEKNEFKVGNAVPIIIRGILGVIFFAAGIFILLKGIVVIFLSFGKPSEIISTTPVEEKPVYYIPSPPSPPKPPAPPIVPYREVVPSQEITLKDEQQKIKEVEQPIRKEPEKIETLIAKELEEIPIKVDKEEKAKREEEFELKLHDSLLPVKDEKDKKLVKEYFSKIFAVLSKELRNQINDLKISKKEKKELLEELAFLTKEEQVKYIAALVDLYKEIPKKLINRIRKLPNVKPKHYDKIVEQLKYMDYEEQIKFIQFLEENA